MRGVLLTTFGAILVVAVCHAQVVYPDEFDSMKVAYEKIPSRRPTFHLPRPHAYRPIEPIRSHIVGLNEPSSAIPTRPVNLEPLSQSAPAVGGSLPLEYASLGPSPPQSIPTVEPLPPFPSSRPVGEASVQNNSVPGEPQSQNTLQRRPPAELPSKFRKHVINVISKGVTKFTLDTVNIIEKKNQNDENLIFSPISLTVTLAMVLLASSGKTFDEVARILGLESDLEISNHSEVVHQVFGYLIQQFDKDYLLDKSLPQSEVAFGLFVQGGYPIRPQFKAISDNVYKSDVINVDFVKQSQVAQVMINNWVKQKTMGKIEKLLNDPPHPSTAVIIASALYFNGYWNQPFDEKNTKRKPFYMEPNKIVDVDMMFNHGVYPFFMDEELKIIAFPYKGLKLSMYAILPRAEGAPALQELKKRLTPAYIDDIIEQMTKTACMVSYPKMKLSSTLQLRSALEDLGLNSLFDARTADLSMLSPGYGNKESSGAPVPSPSKFRNTKNPAGSNFLSRENVSSKQWRPRNRDNLYSYKTSNYTVHQWSNGYYLNYSSHQPVKRQAPQDRNEFIDFLNSNFPPFGLDELRKSGNLTNPGLFADSVVHKVEMTINEKGTEAAAASAILMARSAPLTFVANRPFLFFIRHEDTKLIWFWGSINKPTPFYASP